MSRAAAASLDAQGAFSSATEVVGISGAAVAAYPTPVLAGGVQATLGRDRSAFTEAEWQASLGLIQRAASSARSMHQQAHTIAREAHHGVRRLNEAVRAAEERAQQADVEIAAALARAEQAEALLASLKAKLQVTERRLHEAELQAGLAQERLRVMCERIADEFESLTLEPSTIYAPVYDRAAVRLPVSSPVRMTRPVIPIVSAKPKQQTVRAVSR